MKLYGLLFENEGNPSREDQRGAFLKNVGHIINDVFLSSGFGRSYMPDNIHTTYAPGLETAYMSVFFKKKDGTRLRFLVKDHIKKDEQFRDLGTIGAIFISVDASRKTQDVSKNFHTGYMETERVDITGYTDMNMTDKLERAISQVLTSLSNQLESYGPSSVLNDLFV